MFNEFSISLAITDWQFLLPPFHPVLDIPGYCQLRLIHRRGNRVSVQHRSRDFGTVGRHKIGE
jgi:hypothetical protein